MTTKSNEYLRATDQDPIISKRGPVQSLDVVDAASFNEEYNTVVDGETARDRQNMQRMGKRQEFRRNFRPLSALSFTVLIQATWEYLLISNTQGLIDGGLAGLFWSYIWTVIGLGVVMTCLAEMSSMAPTSGGQYHWVSEFAPAKYQKPLSYVTGWVSVLSWQAGTASGAFLTGTMIQALISVNSPSYEPARWHGTLLIFATVIMFYVSNYWGAGIMPLLQNVLLVVHTFGFLAVVIVLWVLAPHNPPEQVFTKFSNSGGWPTTGLSVMVGQISAIYGALCSDATAHIAEEVADASHSVPRAMFWAYVSNGVLGIVLLITYLFALTDIDAALNDPSAYPFIWVFRQAVSTAGVTALTVIVLVLVLASSISFNAATARHIFAFARDKGLPFHTWISRVDERYRIPANAITVTCGLSCLLALINIGSTTAFNAIISLQISALMFSYAISISCLLEIGVPFNVAGVLYALFAFFWSFWPNRSPVNAESMNYAVVIFGGVIICCWIMYYGQGKRLYEGPVAIVKQA